MAFLHKESIDNYFKKINSSLPFLLLCENQEKYDKHIEIVKTMLFQTKEHLINKVLTNDEFVTELQGSLSSINDYIQDKINEPHNLYELKPVQVKLEKISIEPYDFLIDSIEEKIVDITTTNFEKLTKIFSVLKDKIKPHKDLNETNIKEDVWEAIAKEKLKALMTDFGFKSVSIANKKSWIEIYDWAKNTYDSISEAQANIGFTKIHAGLNGTLNLSFDDNYLNKINAGGLMYTGEFSNMIILGNYPKENQKSIWQHEYAHALDNRAGVALLKKTGEFIPGKNLDHTFLTLKQLNNSIDKVDKSLITNTDILNAEIWTSEAISSILGGQNSQDFTQFQNKLKKQFTLEINKYLIISILPDQEKQWMTLSKETQENLLQSSELTMSSYSILNLLTKNSNINFEQKFLASNNVDHENIAENLSGLCSKICEKLNLNEKEIFFDNMIDSLMKNKSQLFKDLSVYIHHNSYSSDGYTSYFTSSYTADAASNQAMLTGNNYWSRPIEVFARACENLQQPLLLASPEYHLKKESEEKSNSTDYLNPNLNESERVLFLNCLHSMGRLIGMDIKSEIELLEPLQKIVVEEEINDLSHPSFQAFSTATGDEQISKAILMVAKIRTNSIINTQSNTVKKQII